MPPKPARTSRIRSKHHVRMHTTRHAKHSRHLCPELHFQRAGQLHHTACGITPIALTYTHTVLQAMCCECAPSTATVIPTSTHFTTFHHPSTLRQSMHTRTTPTFGRHLSAYSAQAAPPTTAETFPERTRKLPASIRLPCAEKRVQITRRCANFVQPKRLPQNEP